MADLLELWLTCLVVFLSFSPCSLLLLLLMVDIVLLVTYVSETSLLVFAERLAFFVQELAAVGVYVLPWPFVFVRILDCPFC